MNQQDRKQLVSLVVPVYNVEEYLPDFLESLETQTADLSRAELIFVIDGSPDSSAEIIRTWQQERAPHAKVISQPNAGLSGARNTGIKHATTEWVSFPDPDDVLVPEYLSTVFNFLNTKAGATTDLVVTNLYFLNDATGEVTNSHPLRVRFSKTIQTIELDRHPNYIHLSAATGFYRVEEIRRRALEFDSRVKPNFEDAHFTAKYLLGSQSPKVSMLKNAHYWYRRREDGSSLVQTSWNRPEKYIDLPKYGYLALLEETKNKIGVIPEWLQNLILYDIFWYLRADDRMHSPTANLQPDLANAFHETLAKIIALIDEHVISDFRVIPTSWYHRQQLIQRFKPTPVRYTDVSVNSLDVDKQIVRIRYYFAGQKPTEEFRARGYRVQPIHATIQAYTLFGHVMMYERTAWLPATGTLSLELDGHRIQLTPGGFPDAPYRLAASKIWRTLNNSTVPTIGQAPKSKAAEKPGSLRTIKDFAKALITDTDDGKRKFAHLSTDLTVKSICSAFDRSRRTSSQKSLNLLEIATGSGRRFIESLPDEFDDYNAQQRAIVLRLADSPSIQNKFANAWTLIDRDTEAHDNAEHLCRHLITQRKEINAWFVLTEESNDWQRLESEGFRLVRHGSLEHLLLLLNTSHLISSQVDHYIVHPYSPRRYRKFGWKFTFLQHGVSKDDVSRWLNRKPIDLLITASELEYAEFIQDAGPYRFSTKDTVLSGMPRFDRLLSEAQLGTQDRDTLLIMPTWRRWLLGDAVKGGNLRETLDDFWESDYATAWLGLLESEELRRFADSNGLQVAFMPHPNMRPYLQDFSLPEHVRLYSYLDTDVQSLLIRGAALITDYSSIAFDGAYIGIPIVYYQFDQEKFFSGNHVFRQGNWKYETNGLGPVVETHAAVLTALDSISSNKFVPTPEYAKRVKDTFPHPDNKSCERVVAAIEDLRRPLSYDEAYIRVKD